MQSLLQVTLSRVRPNLGVIKALGPSTALRDDAGIPSNLTDLVRTFSYLGLSRDAHRTFDSIRTFSDHCNNILVVEWGVSVGASDVVGK